MYYFYYHYHRAKIKGNEKYAAVGIIVLQDSVFSVEMFSVRFVYVDLTDRDEKGAIEL